MLRKDIKIIFIGMLGTILEWSEYSFFGYMSTRISQLFFPQFDSRTALMATFGIFAAGFLMRPLGALIFGHYGDKKGRKKALSFSLMIMGASALFMSLLPTYEMIGIYAPILLLFSRLLQGISIGGESNGAAIFLIEHSRDKYPHLAGSWIGTAIAIGMMLGATCATIVNFDGMPVWAWRIPFAFGFISCLTGSFLRARFHESPLFLHCQSYQQLVKFPIKTVLQNYKKSFFITVIIAAFIGIYTYVCNLYFVTFLVKQTHIGLNIATLTAGFGEMCIVLLFPLVGYLSDKYNAKYFILTGVIGASIISPIIFILGTKHSIGLAFFAQFLYGLCNSLACAPIFKYVFDLFPTSTRYTGNSFAWSTSISLFGGTAPMVSEYLINHELLIGPAFYVSLSGLLFAITIIFNSSRSNEPKISYRDSLILS